MRDEYAPKRAKEREKERERRTEGVTLHVQGRGGPAVAPLGRVRPQRRGPGPPRRRAAEILPAARDRARDAQGRRVGLGAVGGGRGAG